MIKLEKISKSFKENIVLNVIDLEVYQGELLHIYGSNGCGKSTLLKIIAGLMKPDQGFITLDSSAQIGALIENPHFIEKETIRFNLKFLYELTNQWQEEEVGKLLTFFDLDIRDKRALRKYSIGMRQKVGIIQAVMENQNVILLDEPSRGLDEESVDKFFTLINYLHEKGKTIIISAHDGVEGIKFDRVVHLKNGKLLS